jgi:hypothetical protein
MKRWITILCALLVYLMVSLPCNSVYAAARPVVKAKTSWFSKLGQSIHDFLFGPPAEYIDERKAPLRNRDCRNQEAKRNGDSRRSSSVIRERSNRRRLRKDYDSSGYYSSSDYDSRERYSRRPRRGSSRSDFRQRNQINKRRAKQVSKTSPSKRHRAGKSSPSKESKAAKSTPSKKQNPGKSNSSNTQQSDKSASSKKKKSSDADDAVATSRNQVDRMGPNVVQNPCAAPMPPMLVLEEEEEVPDTEQILHAVGQEIHANLLPLTVHLAFFHQLDHVINIPPQHNFVIMPPQVQADIAPQQMQVMPPQVQADIAPAQQPQQPQHRLGKKKKNPRVDNTQRPPRKRKRKGRRPRVTVNDKEPPQQQPQPNSTVEQGDGDDDEEVMPTTADFIARNQRITEEEEEDKKLDVAEDANGHVGIILEEEEEEEEDINDKKRSSALVDQDGSVSKAEVKDVKKDEPQIVQPIIEEEEEEEEENNELGDDIQVTPTPSPQVQVQQDSHLDHAEVMDTEPSGTKSWRCDVM